MTNDGIAKAKNMSNGSLKAEEEFLMMMGVIATQI